MKVAIIGSGFIAHVHAATIKGLGQELVTIISRKEANAAAFAKKWSIPYYGTSIQLAIEKSDCVHLCTPPIAHYEQVKAILSAGKHLICEKPLTIDPIKAKELYGLAIRKGVVAAVNFNVRYHEACQRAKALINQPAFGAIRLIHGSYLQEFHANSDYYSWRYQPEEGSKMRATTEIGSHWIDLVRYWTGLEITAVAANFGNFEPNRFLTDDGILHQTKKENSQAVEVTSEDAATILLKFSNGAIGNLILSEVSHGKMNQLRLEVTGSHQSIWWDNETPYQLYHGEKDKGVQMNTNPFGGGFEATFKHLFKAIYEAIESPTDKINYPTFKDGAINAAVCEAIYQSAKRDSVWISISLVTDKI